MECTAQQFDLSLILFPRALTAEGLLISQVPLGWFICDPDLFPLNPNQIVTGPLPSTLHVGNESESFSGQRDHGPPMSKHIQIPSRGSPAIKSPIVEI